ncbi:MAG: GAF domain-containing protein [Anaerolineales bacterium]|nr:GAF domain-containing protein [Anaerolineales bacterium]
MSHEAEFDHRLLDIYAELDHDRLIDLVVRYAAERLDAGGSSIFLRDDITGRYVLRSTTGLAHDEQMPTERIEYELGEGLTGWIAKHGRPLRVANPADATELRRIAADLSWTQKYSERSLKPGLAYLGVPILSRDGLTVLGVLRVSGKAAGEAFNEQNETLLSRVAEMVSVAIENSQRYGRERRRARYFHLLLEISSELNPRRSLGEMLQSVADRVRQGFRTEACLIYLQAEEDPSLTVLRAASGVPATLLNQLTYTTRAGVTGQILRTGWPVQIRVKSAFNRWNDPHMQAIAAHLGSGEYRSFVGVPLRLGDQTFGSLELINKIPSRPGHRDWFTDDDEEYLLLLSTAIGGVLEGARYLKVLNEVGVTALRMQRIASFGSVAQRIRHEASNPLAVARLATANLRRDLDRVQTAFPADQASAQEQLEHLSNRLTTIETSLGEVSDKMLEMLRFSQRIGFVRMPTQWNDLVREVLIWLSAERQQRGVEVRVIYGDLPDLLVEPNELFGVLATILKVALDLPEGGGKTIELRTSLSGDGGCVRTEVCVPECQGAAVSVVEKTQQILEPGNGKPQEPSPLYFEWALAIETLREYSGSLKWTAVDHAVCFLLDLPLGQA